MCEYGFTEGESYRTFLSNRSDGLPGKPRQDAATTIDMAINAEPWFVGKDVAQVLGYSDTAQAIRKHVDAEDKGVVEMTTP